MLFQSLYLCNKNINCIAPKTTANHICSEKVKYRVCIKHASSATHFPDGMKVIFTITSKLKETPAKIDSCTALIWHRVSGCIKGTNSCINKYEFSSSDMM